MRGHAEIERKAAWRGQIRRQRFIPAKHLDRYSAGSPLWQK